jgi:hypothetical protein
MTSTKKRDRNLNPESWQSYEFPCLEQLSAIASTWTGSTAPDRAQLVHLSSHLTGRNTNTNISSSSNSSSSSSSSSSSGSGSNSSGGKGPEEIDGDPKPTLDQQRTTTTSKKKRKGEPTVAVTGTNISSSTSGSSGGQDGDNISQIFAEIRATYGKERSINVTKSFMDALQRFLRAEITEDGLLAILKSLFADAPALYDKFASYSNVNIFGPAE